MIAQILEIALYPLLYLYRTFTFQAGSTMIVISGVLTLVTGVAMLALGLDGGPVAVIAAFAYLFGVIQYGEVRSYGLGRGSVNELIASTASLVIFLCVLVLVF